MDKLKSADIKRRDELAGRLRDSEEVLKAEHAEMTTAIEKFNAALDQHNEIINEASGWRDDLVSAIDEYVGDKSDKWQEGDKAASIGEWKSELEGMDFGEVEHVECPDLPDMLHADTLDEMQTEAQ